MTERQGPGGEEDRRPRHYVIEGGRGSAGGGQPPAPHREIRVRDRWACRSDERLGSSRSNRDGELEELQHTLRAALEGEDNDARMVAVPHTVERMMVILPKTVAGAREKALAALFLSSATLGKGHPVTELIGSLTDNLGLFKIFDNVR